MDSDEKVLAPVIRIDVLQNFHNRTKLCNCLYPKYEIDSVNRLVYCQDCGAIVDPFDALNMICRKWSHVQSQLDTAYRQAKELSEYKPFLRAIKELESMQRRKMMPHCPHCNLPVDIVALSKGGAYGQKYGEAVIRDHYERLKEKEPSTDATE